ncbi:ATPase [Phaeobacter gallaeciensis]|uniref:ATPase n=1 Tax=Phaeobacter gallaeciensis TaxID=60890 RepID=A0A1B0ZLL8_9RHOB|nr:ATPase [Phaeobacter gallaeciensis]
MIDDGALWASLPVPAFLIDAEDLIADANSAAEGFLNTSRKALMGETGLEPDLYRCADHGCLCAQPQFGHAPVRE